MDVLNSNSLLFDMVSKTTIYNSTKKGNEEIDLFINEFLKEKIDQGNIVKRWEFIRKYSRRMNLKDIDIMIAKYSNDNLINELIDSYYEIFKNIEFVYEKHIDMIENETNISIKRNLVSLILFNTISYSTFLY